MDNLIRGDNWTLRCPMSILVKRIYYMKTISTWVLRMLFNTFDLSDRQVSLLDGHFNWYKNLFLCYQLRFEPMRSHTLDLMIWLDGWSMIKNRSKVKRSIRLMFKLVQVLQEDWLAIWLLISLIWLSQLTKIKSNLIWFN